MADLFPEAVSKRQLIASNRPTLHSRGEACLSQSFPTPILFPAFWRRWAMELWTSSHPNSAPFDNSQEVLLDIYNPIRPLNPLYQSWDAYLRRGGVHNADFQSGDDRSPCHPSSTRADNCEVPTMPADAKFG